MTIINNNLKYKELQDVFLKLTYLLRGYTLEDFENEWSEAQNLIRLSYVQNSQPFQNIKEGVTYVWINYADTPANRQLNVNRKDLENGNVKFIKSKLRKIDVHWIIYGEEATDISYEMTQAVLSQKANEFLSKYDIKLINDFQEATLIFEDINNRWWQRVEFTVPYYLETSFEEEVKSISSVGVEVYSEKGKVYPKEEEVNGELKS